MYNKQDIEFFRPICNDLKKYSAWDLLNFLVNELLESERSGQNERSPWWMLLVIKWLLIHGDFDSSKKRARPSQCQKVYNKICKKLDTLATQDGQPKSKKAAYLYWRKFYFQEFDFSNPIRIERLLRESILFESIDSEHWMNKEFKRQTGVDISDFIIITVMTIGRFLDKNVSLVGEDWFSAIAKGFPPGTVERYLGTLSLDYDGLRKYLSERHKRFETTLHNEVFESSPLRAYPLVHIPEKNIYAIHSFTILFQSVSYYIYQKLLDYDPEKFKREFGKCIFEPYVRKLIEHMGIHYFDENCLGKIFGSKHKQEKTVDFLVIDGNNKVYIDAKAVEMTYIGEVTNDQNKIKQRAALVLKGIRQAFSTRQNLSQNSLNLDNQHMNHDGKDYLIIVTYKELNIGNGADFYNWFSKSELDELLKKEYDGKPPIPFENMFFLSIDDFEVVAEAVRSRKINFASFLDLVVLNYKKNEAKIFYFRDYINKYIKDPDIPGFLHAELQKILKKLEHIDYKS